MPRASWGLAIILCTSVCGQPRDDLPLPVVSVDALSLPALQTKIWRPGANETDRVVKVGAIVTLTCCSASFHESWMANRAYELFAELVNSVQGGVTINGEQLYIDLVVYDDRGEADIAVQAAQKLLDIGVKFILGPLGDSSNAAVAALLAQHDAVMVTAGTVVDSIFVGRPNVFGVLPMDYFSDTIGLVRRLDPQVRTIAVLKDNMHSSQQACGAIDDIVANSSGDLEVIASYTLEVGNPHVLQFALRHIGQTPDVLISCLTSGCMDVFEAMQIINMNPKALAMSGCINSTGYVMDELSQYSRTLQTRFAFTVNDWMGLYNGARDSAGLSAEGFVGHFPNRTGKEAHRSAANAWTAMYMLVNGMEQANSVEPAAVVSSLNTVTVETMVGNISFDSEGRAIRQVFTAQLGVEAKPRLVLPEPSMAPVIYPFPPWATRPCLKPRMHPVNNATSTVGFQIQSSSNEPVCTSCTSTLWAPAVWAQEPGWRCVDRLCNPGEKQLHDGTCELCPTGWYSNENTSVECTMCPPGTITRSPGASTCEDCDLGQYADEWGSSECKNCSAGHHNPLRGSRLCWPCRGGFYSDVEGSVLCTSCSPGYVANGVGMEQCDPCLPGKHTKRGLIDCSECEVGRYQPRQAQMECIKCPESGADCATVGLDHPLNSRNWYLSRNDNGDWMLDSCIDDDVCLPHGKCAEGTTGRLCHVCLPSRTKEKDQGCVACPDVSMNLFIFVFFLLIACCCVTSLTALAISTAGRSKAITSALAKLFLNYVTTMSVVFVEIERKIDQIHRSRGTGDGYDAFQDQLMQFTLEVVDLGLGFLMRLMNVGCLLEPRISDHDAMEIERMANRATYEQFDEDAAAARKMLADLHWKTLLAKTIMWCSMPVIIGVAVVIFAGFLFHFHVKSKGADYRDAIEFFEAVEVHGFDVAVARSGLPGSTIQNYMACREYRLLGIWRVMPLLDKLVLKKRAFVFHFLRDAEPMIVVVCFFTYPYVVKGILGPLNCTEFLEVGVQWNREYPDVKCNQYDDVLFWVSVVLFVGMGLGVPAVGYFLLQGARGRLLELRFQRTWGFITGGYEIDRIWWETLVLVRKSTCTLLSYLHMSTGLRILSLLAASIIFHLLHIWYKPFDNKYGELLDRIESRHLHAWVLYSLVLLGLNMVDTGANDAVMVLFCVCILIVHTRFTVMIAYHLLVHLRNQLGDKIMSTVHQDQHLAYMKACHHEERLFAASKPPPQKFTIKEAMKQETTYLNIAVLETYHRYLQTMPYLSLDSQRMWATLVGNKGSSCELADTGDPMDKSFKVSQVKVPVDFAPCPERDRRYFVDIVSEAFEFVLVNQQVPAFSVNLLDFVLRCGYAFDVEGNPRNVIVGDAARAKAARRSYHLRNHEREKLVQKLAERYTLQANRRQMTRLLASRAFNFFGKVISSANASKYDSPSKLQLTEEVLHDIRANTVHMFQHSCYLRGLTLQEFQLNITSKLMSTPKEILVEWLDQFERHAELKYAEHSQNAMFFRPETLLAGSGLSKWRSQHGAGSEVHCLENVIVEDEAEVGVQANLDVDFALASEEEVVIRELSFVRSATTGEFVCEDNHVEVIAFWMKMVVNVLGNHSKVWQKGPRLQALRRINTELRKLDAERRAIETALGLEQEADGADGKGDEDTLRKCADSSSVPDEMHDDYLPSLLGGGVETGDHQRSALQASGSHTHRSVLDEC